MVVAIVGIIVGIAVPGYQSMRAKLNVSGATSTLMGHLKQARHLAIAEGRSVDMVIAASSYTFDSGGAKERTVQMVSFGNATLSSSVATFTFKSRGTSTAGHIQISSGTVCKRIEINTIGRAYLAACP